MGGGGGGTSKFEDDFACGYFSHTPSTHYIESSVAEGWVAKSVARQLATASTLGSNPDIPQKS